jgi:hypothetical protein
MGALKLAEGKGFEPSIPLWSIHTFQACAFDHSATPLVIIPGKNTLKNQTAKLLGKFSAKRGFK